MEEKAARAYDMAALKYWGPSSHINFPVMITFFFSSHFFSDWVCIQLPGFNNSN